MKHVNGTDPDKKKTYLTYGIIGVGLVVALALKNIAIGLIIGLVGISLVDNVDKRHK